MNTRLEGKKGFTLLNGNLLQYFIELMGYIYKNSSTTSAKKEEKK